MTGPLPGDRALKPNQQERAQRRTTIDTLLARALRGVLTIPEAALLADYVRAEQRLADKTRQSLAHTTRALQRHREAAATAILEAEQRAEQAEAQQQPETEAPADPWSISYHRPSPAELNPNVCICGLGPGAVVHNEPPHPFNARLKAPYHAAVSGICTDCHHHETASCHAAPVAQQPAEVRHTGGNAEDCPACIEGGLNKLGYPWECPEADTDDA